MDMDNYIAYFVMWGGEERGILSKEGGPFLLRKILETVFTLATALRLGIPRKEGARKKGGGVRDANLYLSEFKPAFKVKYLIQINLEPKHKNLKSK